MKSILGKGEESLPRGFGILLALCLTVTIAHLSYLLNDVIVEGLHTLEGVLG